MTVKCLNEIQKSVIADLYLMKINTIRELCEDYGVSRRTIGRVLVERGVEPVRNKAQVQLDLALQEQIPKRSLFQRIKAFFGRLFY